jgi:putative transposase
MTRHGISRRQKGSARRKKAVNRCARHYQTVKRQRADFPHKVARHLVHTDDTISRDDVQGSNLVRNRHLAKRISDAGWAQLRTTLEFKAACTGKRVVAVPAH